MEENKDYSFALSIGPVHPALKEPLRLNLEIEGEQVKKVDFELNNLVNFQYIVFKCFLIV